MIIVGDSHFKKGVGIAIRTPFKWYKNQDF